MTGWNDVFVNDVLSALEDLELPLLSWGVTGGVISQDEVDAVVELLLREHEDAPASASVADVRAHLISKALIYPAESGVSSAYRTRLGEALRLTTSLRQLFKPSWSRADEPQWWLEGRRLVADYRLHVAPRRYPERNVPLTEALKELRSAPGWDDAQDDVAKALIGSNYLAGFQVRATRTVFSRLSGSRSSGVIVGAGTGSGKTIAFYLPAFAAMTTPTRKRVHTLALYPRIELLRDQLGEALRTAERLTPALSARRRPLRIGVLFGATPTAPDTVGKGKAAWRSTTAGFVCPYVDCPHCGTGELIWANADRMANPPKEVLRCVKCAYRSKPGQVALTRRSMQANYPDLLFTTTEMLSRTSADPGMGALLGWQPGSAPDVVLLDEVHTYVGMHGAQVALMLRRWRHANPRKAITFVGLSATLRDSERFFTSLTGLNPADVESVEPAPNELKREGREYSIALRGDPVSGVSLLSTSIQTAMLFGRLLDVEQYLFGTTGFVFTDDLDVTNRFYDDLRDAEAGQTRAMRPTPGKPVLAALRSREGPQQSERDRDGQDWSITQKIGRPLSKDLYQRPLRIGRTSSQDAGMAHDADLTVASPSLEVGVNDPRVGLVIQHKAPRNSAAFIQRRGRAGRRRNTRPVTVVTLSDYGRDRLAYQAYESLFAPEVTAPRLPVNNRFILKIQATHALIDWLGVQLRRRGVTADPRRTMRAPSPETTTNEIVAKYLVGFLKAVLEEDTARDSLTKHLQNALSLSTSDLEAVMWEPPRSLMLSVAPTALRRLESGWQALREDPGAYPGSLLPEFVTTALFDQLNLPEVTLSLPFGQADEPEKLGIGHALREAVPGRVSKRYGVKKDDDRTWVAPPVDTNLLELETFVRNGFRRGTWQPVGGNEVDVVRPLELRLTKPDSKVQTRSHGAPVWGTEIVVPHTTAPHPGDIPSPSRWHSRVKAIAFSSHSAGNPIEVRRMSLGADISVAYDGGREDQRQISYVLNGRPAALGFDLEADGIQFTFAPLDVSADAVQAHLKSPQWRSFAFFHTLVDDQVLCEVSNRFKREWLAHIYLTAFALAGANGKPPADVLRDLSRGKWLADLREILTVMYRGSADNGSEHTTTDRLVRGMIELTADQVVVDAVERVAELLITEDIAARTTELAHRAYRETLAAAVLAASIRACPDAQDNDLAVDIFPSAGVDGADVVWLTETAPGGLGVVEYLIRYYSEDPRRFWTLVDSILGPSVHEYVDGAVVRLLRNVTTEPSGEAAQAMRRLRQAGSAHEADSALADFRAAWTNLDGPPRRAAVGVASTRLLRPGSDGGSDIAAMELIDDWDRLEAALGIEVDARVIAYIAGKRPDARSTTRSLNADQAFSLLWLRGQLARNQHLQYFQPFAPEAIIDRLLVAAAHTDRVQKVSLSAHDWMERYRDVLAQDAEVDLVSAGNDSGRVAAEALYQIPAIAIDRDVLRLYGEVRSVTRHTGEMVIRVEIREAIQ